MGETGWKGAGWWCREDGTIRALICININSVKVEEEEEEEKRVGGEEEKRGGGE